MMKYTGKYYRVLTLFIKKYLKEQYGKIVPDQIKNPM